MAQMPHDAHLVVLPRRLVSRRPLYSIIPPNHCATGSPLRAMCRALSQECSRAFVVRTLKALVATPLSLSLTPRRVPGFFSLQFARKPRELEFRRESSNTYQTTTTTTRETLTTFNLRREERARIPPPFGVKTLRRS